MVIVTKIGMMGCKACDVADKILNDISNENIKVEKLQMEEGRGFDLSMAYNVNKFPFFIIKNENTGEETTYNGIVSETPLMKAIKSVT